MPSGDICGAIGANTVKKEARHWTNREIEQPVKKPWRSSMMPRYHRTGTRNPFFIVLEAVKTSWCHQHIQCLRAAFLLPVWSLVISRGDSHDRRVLTEQMSVYHMHAVPMEVRRWCRIPWGWSYRWLQANTCMLGMNSGPLQDQWVLLTAKPSFQPESFFRRY